MKLLVASLMVDEFKVVVTVPVDEAVLAAAEHAGGDRLLSLRMALLNEAKSMLVSQIAPMLEMEERGLPSELDGDWGRRRLWQIEFNGNQLEWSAFKFYRHDNLDDLRARARLRMAEKIVETTELRVAWSDGPVLELERRLDTPPSVGPRGITVTASNHATRAAHSPSETF